MAAPSFRDRLRYKADQFFQSGFALQVTIAFALVAGLIVVFSILAELLLVLPGSDFTLPAAHDGPGWMWVRFWWVLTHIFDTYWIETRTVDQVFSTILTLVNYLVFAGVIGLVGSRIAARLESIRRGTSRVIESDHVVLLGWSEKIFPIVSELVQGFGHERTVFVLLAQRPVDEMEAELRSAFGKPRASLRWVLRTGAPTDPDALDRLSIETARVIIVLRPDDPDIDADTQAIKSAITVVHALRADRRGSAHAPVVIAEIERPEFHRIIRAIDSTVQVKIVQPSDYVAKILLQTARDRRMIEVYNELLGHDGHELYVHRFPELDGEPWARIITAFPEAIPVGYIHDGRTCLLASAEQGSRRLPDGSRIILLAENARTEPVLPEEAEAGIITVAAPVTAHESETPVKSRFLILGYDPKLRRILTELHGYARSTGRTAQVLVASTTAPDDSTALPLEGEYDMLRVEVLHHDYLLPGVLENLHPESYDAVIVLGEHMPHANFDELDTRVIMTLLLLQSMRDTRVTGCGHLVAEIRNPANRRLAEAAGCARDVVITNELISKMIAQISREPALDDILRDLLDESGAEVYCKPAAWYVVGTHATFRDVMYAAAARGEVAIGLQAHDPQALIRLNPPKDEPVDTAPGSRVCVIAESEH
ncbi:MAG: hypothetical protein HY962_08070 [Ignavibacteriae bacterium]|nr:hypothetical protein [Ignavibacteriota bacterium]